MNVGYVVFVVVADGTYVRNVGTSMGGVRIRG